VYNAGDFRTKFPFRAFVSWGDGCVWNAERPPVAVTPSDCSRRIAAVDTDDVDRKE